MKETGAALAGEMSGHTFFKRALVRLRRRPLRGRAPARDPVAPRRSVGACSTRCPTRVSTPELNVACAEGEHARARSRKLRRDRDVSRRDRRDPHRRPARRVSRRLRPRARVEHDAGDRAALRGGRRRRARAHPERVPPRARTRQARRRAAVLSACADVVTLADIEAARERIAGGIYDSPCVESIPLSQLTGAHIYCKLDYLQRTGSFKERGARNALLLLSARAAQARRDRRVGRQSRAGHRLSRQPARHSGDRRHAEVRGADQGDQLPAARRATSSCTAPT